MEVKWLLKKFEELTPHEVYAILKLRSEVFVVEQNCVYLDADDNDQQSYHLQGLDNEGKLVAYTRLVPAGVIYDIPSIGRVITSAAVRRSGIGKELMMESIKNSYQLFGKLPIKIGAQFYLKKFYEAFGFEQISGIYLEDGIEHIYMIKQAS